ncbi:UNVERIFIED_CONTAM: hypothetical protein FKN15_046783 [Acipenser sinensis]
MAQWLELLDWEEGSGTWWLNLRDWEEHWNYFGVDENLGPVAVSLRREKLEDSKEHGQQYNYRVTFRTSELTTLRGSILEDAVPSTSKHGSARGLPLKEVLEYLIPELNTHCLRLALNTPKVTEQLMKLDEQGPRDRSSLLQTRKALEEPVDSELLTSNVLQLLRKRHIGNDIVTIVFQEPGAQPFSPKNIRSHFQHVFVVVRAHEPCSDNTCYSVAVARSKDVPSFGPPIPKGVTFPKSTVFRDFLLAKVINAENAAHKSDKFRAMATRTRQEYLRDLAERHVTSTPIDPSGKFPFISLASKRKEKSRPYSGAELRSLGGITWHVLAEDYSSGGAEVEGLLAISNEYLVIIDREAKSTVFNCSVRDVIGWTHSSPTTLKVFYERGECLSFHTVANNYEDFREVVKRLEFLTKGCNTNEMTLRRNGLGQLGFHVNYEGIVAEVEPYGYAWQAGLRQGSRLVEICKVAVATLSHEQMIDLLRTSVTVKVVIIPPHEDSTPRRGCSEMYRMPVVEYKTNNEGAPYEYKLPFRNHSKWQRTASSPQQSSPQGHAGSTPSRAVSVGGSMGKAQGQQRGERCAIIPRSVSSDGRPLDPKRFSPGSNSNYALVSQHGRNSPSSLSYSSDTGSGGGSHWRQKSVPEGFEVRHSPLSVDRQSIGEMGSSGKSTPSWQHNQEADMGSAGSERPAHASLCVYVGSFLYCLQGQKIPHKPSFPSSAPCRRSLHRTLSDESIYSGQREPTFSSLLAQALPNEVLFSSTRPLAPSTLPSRRPTYILGVKSLHGDLSASDTSLSELHRAQQDPGLMPLPNTGMDSGLDWSHLVDAAKAFEDQRASILRGNEVNPGDESAATSPQQPERQLSPQFRLGSSEVPSSLTGKVSQLESIVKLLQEDLKKEKEDKAMLQMQVQSLREDNQRLQEESQNASAKLNKFTEWVFNTIDMN